MTSPVPCTPGFYNANTGEPQCAPCDVGYICASSGNSQQSECPKGKICEIQGHASPTNLCPAGSYCRGLISIRTPNTSSGPTLCPAATFCLNGVVDSVVLEGDASHPQDCIQGTYCEEGTSSPAAAACPPGNYCPSKVSEPTPAPIGHFAGGFGNGEPTLCPPGTYSTRTGLAECDPCPAGFFCPNDGTVVPTICPAGMYKAEDPDVVYCSPCPQGTWSDTPGLTAESECMDCAEALVCLEEGLTSLDQAQPCPEGYVCGESTTTYLLENSPCPGGFWCSEGTSSPEQFNICEPGYYCPEATGETSQRIHVCLPGFYCPEATNATVNSLGEFEFIKQSDYAYVIQAKEQANEECVEEECQIEVPVFTKCTEDYLLPDELLQTYTSLKCPDGTTSKSQATCVGQCASLGIDSYIQVIDPAMSGRRLEEARGFHNFTLNSLEVAKVDFDFSEVDPLFLYKEHFNIVFLNSEDARLAVPEYFTEDGNYTQHRLIRFTVINYSQLPETIQVGVSLHNSLFAPILSQLENTMRVTIMAPQRAALDQDSLFFTILYKSDFEAVQMPYNLIDLTGSGESSRDSLYISVGANEEWYGKVYASAPFDETFWMTYEASAVNFPWIPFLTNCELFGDRIYVHQLLEAEEYCKLVSQEDTIVVEPIPFTGITPTADACELEITCYFAEAVTQKRANFDYWFDLTTETTLFYMVTAPQSVEELFKVNAGTTYDSLFTTDVQDLTDNVIAVNFVPGVGNGLPTVVELTVNYHQVDETTKNLVNMKVGLTEYSEERLFDEHPSYTLRINYRPSGWFDLLNSFKLGIPVFMLIFVLVSLGIVGLVMAIYAIHMAFLRMKNPPKLHFQILFFAASIPPALGTFYGSFPIFIVIFILNSISASDPFQTTSADWGSVEPPDADQARLNNRGRLGLSMLFVAILMLNEGTRLLIPLPDDPEEEEEDEEEEEEKNEFDEETGSPLGTEEPEENEAFHPDEGFYRGMNYKRRFFLTVCIALAVITTIKLELSYSQLFIDNIFLFLFFFMLLDLALYQLFSRLILHEAILVSPFLASLAINEIIVLLAADSFVMYISCFLFSFALTVLQRLYLNPLIEYFEGKLQNFAIFLMRKSAFFERMFRKIIIEGLKQQSSLLATNNKGGEDDGQGMEGLMGTMVEYSAQVQANLMAPFVLLFILFFADATQLPKNYGIKQSDVSYYLLFSCIIIIPQLIIDIFLFHLVESLYSYKLFDYLTYCSYRFRTRRFLWKHTAEEKLDRSVILPWRTIDSMCYSSQYYFTVTVASWGIICLSLSFTIMLRNQFNPFNDPLFLFIFIIHIFAKMPFKKLLKLFASFFKIWKPKSHPVFIDESPDSEENGVVQLIDDYVKENEEVRQLESELFKAKFLRKNKIWLINNLDRIAGDDSTANDQLFDIYHILNKIHKNKLKETKKADIIEEKLLCLPFNQERKSRDDISIESSSDTKKALPVLTKSTVSIAYHWLSHTKTILEYKKTIQNEDFLLSDCEICKASSYLKVVPRYSFYHILQQFKEGYKGLFLTSKMFKNYYCRNQILNTYCFDCAYIRIIRQRGDELANSPLVRIANQELKLLKTRFVRRIPPVAKKISLKWLFECRSRLAKRDEFTERGPLSPHQMTLRSWYSGAVSDLGSNE